MKTNCDIIRDLLPLYAEHITSEASNALVEEHLAECEACRAELEQMEQPVPVRPEAQPDAPLRRIRAALQRRSIRAAIGSVLAALCALALIFWMGTACVPATTEQAQFWTYNRKENGADICILEAQGEGVWLDMADTFSWGKPQITVRAMRYRFPGMHRVLTALVGSDRFSVWVMVSPTQLLVDQDAAFTVHQCLHTLDEPYKEVFSLRVFGELPFERIGLIFGHNAAWARVTYYRAKTQLQKMLSAST